MTKEQIKEFTLRTTNSNHSGLILVLFDVVNVYISDSINAYDSDDKEQYIKSIRLAKKSHNELISCINPKDELGRKVLSVFRFIYGKLVSSEVKRRPDDLDRCRAMLDNLRVGFEKLHSLDDEEPVMKNAHQVYAGLTYGKGTLSESTLGDTYNRGFMV
ncbi:MAG: flagellar protein FliS [Lachnospiraceae bacterium]|nr:flagellar protein FliS [Lachnospiraceae bacterium]